MYKNYSVIVVAFLLSGCPGPGDRIPPKEPANVTLKDNQICITAPVYPGEFVSSVQFSDGQNNNLLKTLEHDPVYVANGQCLPTFGYDFQKGHTYTVFYTIEKNATDSARYLSAVFSTKNGLQQMNP